MTELLSILWAPDQALLHWVALYGAGTLAVVAAIVFAETGFVVTPFLPGDSLLFLTGTVAAAASMNVPLAIGVLSVAAIAGDALNFAIGRRAAPALIRRLHGRWLKPQHLAATEAYFERYGSATIVVARFVPIVRTFAPFLAGAGHMPYGRFAAFNAAGGLLWVGGLVTAGATLGHLPWVRSHLSQATLAVVVVSLLPLAHTAWRVRRDGAAARTANDASAPGGPGGPPAP